MSANSTNTTRLNLEGLSERIVPTIVLNKGNLVITGTNGNDIVTVSEQTKNGANQIYVGGYNGVSWKTFPASQVSKIVFLGNAGNDVFNFIGYKQNGYLGTKPVHAEGGAGNDTLNGGTNHDTFLGGAGNDKIAGNAGNDVAAGGDGDDTITGGSGNDELQGGKGNDWLLGGVGNDRLFGEDGYDYMFGEAGDDTLVGGNQLDFAHGGSGADQFYSVKVDGAFIPKYGLKVVSIGLAEGRVDSDWFGVYDADGSKGDKVWS